MKKASKKASKAKSAKKKKKAVPQAPPKKAKAKKGAKKAAKKRSTATPAKKLAKKGGKKSAKSVVTKRAKSAGAVKKRLKKAAAKITKKVPARKAAPKRKAKAPPVRVPELPLGARAAPLPTPTITPDTPAEILLALAKLLLEDPQYHQEVRLAAESPREYVDTFADDLSARGISEPQPDLPWIALTDGLSKRDALIQLDWPFEPSDLSDALQSLLSHRSEHVDLSGLPGYDDSTAALQVVGDRLHLAGLALVTVDNNQEEDAFPIAVMPADNVEEAQRLAATLGLGSLQRWSSEDFIG